MKNILRITSSFVFITTGLTVLTPAVEAQYSHQNVTSYTPQVTLPRVSPYPQLYAPHYRPGGISQGINSVVIVNPRSRPRSVIVVPGGSNVTVVTTPHSNVKQVIINTTPSYQCGSVVFGSPIPSPIPINPYTGQSCSLR